MLSGAKPFFSTFDKLRTSLEVFWSNNPKSIVMLSLLDLDLIDRAEEFLNQGLVNHIDIRLEDDYALMERGILLLQ